MSNLPNPDDIDTWITESIDASRPDELKHGWKRRALGGKTVTQVMSDLPSRKCANFSCPADEYGHAAKAARDLGIPVTAFIRNCVGKWLVETGRAEPHQIPSMTDRGEIHGQ